MTRSVLPVKVTLVLGVVGILASLGLSACRRHAAQKVEAQPAAVPTFAQAYPLDAGPISAGVTGFCAALAGLPATRRAACCDGAPAPGVAAAAPVDDCQRRLAAAVRAGSIRVEEAGIEACARAMDAAFRDCAWLGSEWPATPASCLGLLTGRVPADGACRTSLDCQAPLHCDGDLERSGGHCRPPREHGEPCTAPTDALSELLRQEDLDERHPTCEGHCERGRCSEPFSLGVPCERTTQCGPRQHCARTRCSKGARSALGETCVDGRCLDGLKCVAGHCATPSPIGAACDDDSACLGICAHATGAPRGHCAPDCRPR